MNRRSFLTSGLATAAVAAAPAWSGSSNRAAEFYVSPGGRDENPGSKSRPFATLQRARDEVRSLVAAGLKTNVTVWIHGGTYTLQDTLVFGPEDSGTDQYSITYEAVPGEEPVFTSGVKITGWKRRRTCSTICRCRPKATSGWRMSPNRSAASALCTTPGPSAPRPRQRLRSRRSAAGRRSGDLAGRLRNLYFPPGAIRNWSNLDDVEIVIRSFLHHEHLGAGIGGRKGADGPHQAPRHLCPGQGQPTSSDTPQHGWRTFWMFWTTPAHGCSTPIRASSICGRGRRSRKRSWRRACAS